MKTLPHEDDLPKIPQEAWVKTKGEGKNKNSSVLVIRERGLSA
jgi:hypothetical protein